MKKKTIILCTVLFVLLAGIYYIYASFQGSFFRKALLTNKAKKYVSEHYAGRDFEVSSAIYNFKSGSYSCRVTSPVSEDTAFCVYETREKKLTDDYESRVTNRENTYFRLSRELDLAVEEVLLSVYPRRTRLILCDFHHGEEFDRAKFELDMPLTLSKLPHPAELTVWVETSQEEPTWDEVAGLLREMVDVTEAAGLDITYFSISVEYPYEEDDGERKPTTYGSIVGINDVPKEAITGNQLDELLTKERTKRELEVYNIEHNIGDGK